MPTPKRRYGYVGTPDSPRPSSQSTHVKPPSRLLPALVAVLLFPFTLLKWMYRGLSWVFRHRPHLDEDASATMWRWITKLTVLGLCVGLLGGTILVFWASSNLPDPDRLTDRQVSQSTKIFDRTGKHLLYEIFVDQKRTLVNLDDIPKDLIHGVIATEDKTFYEHNGVRPLSILRAAVMGLLPGRRVAGTSTLTQQLVKNAILTNERTLTRKLKEIILSIRLEQKYTKDQILKIYFNEIPYGSTNYGVEAAAQSYFGKHVSDLDLAESATLAGFPKSPSTYIKNSQALRDRRNFVLQRMFEEGYITKEQKEKAQAEPLAIKSTFAGRRDLVAPHFVKYVRDQLNDKFGEDTVSRGGLRVITTLDWDKQQFASSSISNRTKLLADAGTDNAALIAIDPRTGQILAHVGSRDFSDDSIRGQFDVAVDGKRQPGSSFKPIIYAAAFEKGYTPDTVLTDVLTDFDATDRKYEPRNYDGSERGPVTMRQALQGSLNIPAVQTLYLVGPRASQDMTTRMGYTTLSDGNFGLTLVLGGGEVRLIEHVAAYGIFANNGIKMPTVSILSVEDASGDMLYEWKPSTGERVLDPSVTATLSNVLSDDAARAYVFGAGSALTLPGRPVAAKTGTTNNYVDAWTVGYTPSLVAGVWAGNTDNTPMKAGYGGSKVAGQIWNAFMQDSLKNTPVEGFPEPPPNDTDKAILRGTTGGTTSVSVNKLNGKLATSSTPAFLIEQRSFLPAHSILYYVNKDDPRGPLPEHPEDDPQFQIWEDAFRSWVDRQTAKDPNWHANFSEPPTEYDTPTDPTLAPTITVDYPLQNSVVTSPTLSLRLSATSPRGVSHVYLFLDGEQIGSFTAPPFNWTQDISRFANTTHTLNVVAQDDQGNLGTKTVTFQVQL